MVSAIGSLEYSQPCGIQFAINWSNGMDILFISNDGFSNNTSSVIQNKGIVIGLNKLGHTVDFLTLKPQKQMVIYDESMNDMDKYIRKTYYIPLTKLYERLAAHQKHFVENTGRDSHTVSKLKGKVRRFIKNLLIYDIRALNVFNLKKVSINLQKYDIIISSSDPKSTHYLACKLLALHGYTGKFIQYWGDPLYLDITRDKTCLDFFIKKSEYKILKQASRIVYATPFTLEEQKTLYPLLSDKMTYAHQVPVDFQPIKVSVKKKSECVKIVYCGDYRSKTRNIIPLYKAVSSMSVNYHLTICGTSDVFLKNNSNVSVLGSVNHKTAENLESEADILVAVCNLRGSQIPGKIYYLCRYNTPIIIILDGEYSKDKLRDYFGQFNRFILCDNNIENIVNAFREAQEMKFCIDTQLSRLTTEYMASRILGQS